jgi:hypothetical protein
MAIPYVLTGMLRDELTVALDEALPLKSGRVRLTLEAVGPEPLRSGPGLHACGPSGAFPP